MSAAEEIALARLADLLFKAAEVGLNRMDVVNKIDEMEKAGKSKTEIYVGVKEMLDTAIQELLSASSQG